MKTVKFKLTALLLTVVMVFSGCLNMEMSVKINKDGSGKMTIKEDIGKEAMLEFYASMAKEQYGQEMSKSVLEPMVDKSMREQGAEIVTIDGVEYYSITETQKLSNKELNESFARGDEKSLVWITGDTFYAELDTETQLSTSGSTDSLGVDLSEYEDLIKENAKNMKVTIAPEFTAPIVSSNGKIDESNPNKVSFEYDYAYTGKKMVMFATTNPKVTVKTVKASIKKANKVNTSKVKKLKAVKVKKKAKTASLKYTLKKAKKVKNYEIQYSLKKSMKNAKTITTKKTKGTIKNLKKGKKYYVRVRCSKTNYAGATVYSKWSKKAVKRTKK